MINLSYIAGFIDGEGSLVIRNIEQSGNIYLGITNTNLNILEQIKEVIGGGIYSVPITGGTSFTGRKPVFRLQLSSNKLYFILKKLLPYLVVKKKQAKLCIECHEQTILNRKTIKNIYQLKLLQTNYKQQISQLNRGITHQTL